jgi:hypothetical protein
MMYGFFEGKGDREMKDTVRVHEALNVCFERAQRQGNTQKALALSELMHALVTERLERVNALLKGKAQK